MNGGSVGGGQCLVLLGVSGIVSDLKMGVNMYGGVNGVC